MNTLQPQDRENRSDYAKSALGPPPRTFGRDITNQQLQEFDSPDSVDPTRLTYYAREIHSYLHASQGKFLAKVGYMKRQTDINEKMRSILVDWLADVHCKFRMAAETLFLAVNFMDRYLEREVVHRTQLQLVGVVALQLACKMEEIRMPDARDFVYVTDNAYTLPQFLEMETHMLAVLNFSLAAPTSYRFYERYSRIADLSETNTHLGEYLLELGLLDVGLLRYKPSLVAAAAVYLARKISDPCSCWCPALIEATLHSDSEVKPCAKELVILLQAVEKSKLTALPRKFSSEKYSAVARTQRGSCM